MSRTARGIVLSLFTALLTGVVAPAAHAVQTSGSIQLIPSNGTRLLDPGESFTVKVFFRNTSTTTPNDLSPPAATGAVLSGPVSVDLSCLQGCDCTTQDTDDIAFLGCDLAGGIATSCTPGVAGEILINLPAGGATLADNDSPVLLTTIRLRNEVVPPAQLPTHFIRATTEECAVRSCETFLPVPTDCVDCAAEGCTSVRGTAPIGEPLSCKHGCLNRIEFFPQNPAVQDNLHVNALFFAPTYDPATQPFALTVRRNGTVIYQVAEPFIPETSPGSGTFVLSGPGNNNTPGLTKITITRRSGTGTGGVDCSQGWFKVIVDARGDFSAAAAVDPTLTMEYQLNGQVFSVTGQWKSTSGAAGIKQISFDIPKRSPC